MPNFNNKEAAVVLGILVFLILIEFSWRFWDYSNCLAVPRDEVKSININDTNSLLYYFTVAPNDNIKS